MQKLDAIKALKTIQIYLAPRVNTHLPRGNKVS
jgi:hypothetical protein